MKSIFKNYLFNQHIFVNDTHTTDENVTEIAYSMANSFNINIVSGHELLTKDMIFTAAPLLGISVPTPFYIGFPESVRRLSSNELLFDQFVHYTKTYGFNLLSEAGHSILEDDITRSIFKEYASIKNFKVITEEEAIAVLSESLENLLMSTRPLNDKEYDFFKKFISDYHYTVENCASKNTAIKLLLDFRDIHYAEFLSMSDVIKFVDELNYRIYNNKNIRQLNLKNQDRKLITAIINTLCDDTHCDMMNCFEKKAIWAGLLHHIHYQPINDTAKEFVHLMRGKENHSAYAMFEKAISDGEIRLAADLLKKYKGSGAILRNLNYIVSRCKTNDDIDYVIKQSETKNPILLLQLLMNYSHYPISDKPRTFKFTKYNMLRVHTETALEQKQRQSMISSQTAKYLCENIRKNLKDIYKNRLGNVYIDTSMKNIALPLQENTSSGGFGTLSKGSRLHIPEGKKIRAFTYWEKVNDIDLSVIGLTNAGKYTEFSWRTMAGRQSDAITYSGDEINGYNGGSEYFDIDVETFKKYHPNIKQLVFCNNVFSNATFANCVCRAGYMLRDIHDSGEIYEPKTVQTSFSIDCDSRFAYLFAIDLQSNDFIWLNIARDSHINVAGATAMNFLTDYFDITKIINVYDFFSMLATNVVDNEEEADIIVSDREIDERENVEIIRSYNTARILALMN